MYALTQAAAAAR